MTKTLAFMLLSFCCFLAAPVSAQTIGGGTCSASTLSGTYSLTLTGRNISGTGIFSGSFQGSGSATFDGVSMVTLTGTYNTNLKTGQTFTFSGTYTLPSNCLGSITFKSGSTATFTLVAWDSGHDYNISGVDPNYVYTGTGNNFVPVCGTATLSGAFPYTATGFTLSGTTQNGADDEAGVFQFDGQGNVTVTYTITSSSAQPASLTSTGKYSVASNCQATATLTDSNNVSNALNMSISGTYGGGFDLLEANPQFVRSGGGHAAFLNPTQSIGNVASYVVNYTPPGSIFVIFGTGLATGTASALNVPLPYSLRTTSVTVNGEEAPLFYVDTGQIDAQMPLDIPTGAVASVIVKNGSATSNATAVYVPATGTPGIIVYGNNRAVVVNADGNVNSPTDAAAVGDELVAYFTGGGPVNASGKLTTGAVSPNGLSPVTETNSVTVGSVNATVKYMGLTPGSVGLYQANFIVPQLAKGTYSVVINIAGQNSNAPLITVSN